MYLIDLFKILTPEETSELRQVLSYPLFNQGIQAKAVEKLFDAVVDAAPDFNQEKVDKKILYTKVYGDREFISWQLERLMGELARQVKNYLLFKRYFSEEHAPQKDINWLSVLRERGLTERAKRLIIKYKNEWKTEKVESVSGFHNAFLLAEEVHFLECRDNQFQNDLGTTEVVFTLDLFYHNYRIHMLNNYWVQKKAARLPDMQYVGIDANHYFKDSKLLQISHLIYEILSKETPIVADFETLMVQLRINEKSLDSTTLIQLYAFLRNACTMLINAGQLEFTKILHQLHRENLAAGLFYTHGQVPPNVYINIVQIALRVKEYAWATQFTEDFKDRLLGGDGDRFFYRFNLAHCLFAEKKYDEALSHIPDVPSASHYHHTMRRLELKIYYETNSDLLHYKLFAFRKYIERTAGKAISPSLRSMNLNFLNLLLQISQSPAKDKQRSAKLISRINQKQLLSDRAWLLEKAQELGG